MSNIHLTDLRELRIGNYVQAIDGKQIFIICSLVPGYSPMVKNLEGKLMPGDFYEGIPITDTLMYQLGFEKTGYNDLDWGHSNVQYMAFTEYHLYISTAMGYVEISKEIKFVHELMNAWYWITGTELTLTENGK